jgi:DNA damage-binding protein 1
MTPIFSLQPMLDVPIYGRIATLELFRPHVSISIYFTFRLCVFVVLKSQLNSLMFFYQGEAQDFLFIATERYKFCVLQWDAETSELITRFKLKLSNDIHLLELFVTKIFEVQLLNTLPSPCIKDEPCI